MKVLSLYDGMACGMISLLQAGISVDRYAAFEIDEYAKKTAKHNFPNIEHYGDVLTANFKSFEGFDLVIGGSPCTFWSIANMTNRETTHKGIGGKLFNSFARAIQTVKPKYFLYENNASMSVAVRDHINKTFGFHSQEIDSSTLSAQIRKRLYWVGKRMENGIYTQVYIPNPEDHCIKLSSIIDGPFYGLYSDWNNSTVYDKARCLGTGVAMCRTRTTQQVICEEVTINKIARGGQHDAVYKITKPNGYTTIEPVAKYLRYLSVQECMRLQTVPEWYQFPVSKTRAYKMLGNGWNINTITHLLKHLENDNFYPHQLTIADFEL